MLGQIAFGSVLMLCSIGIAGLWIWLLETGFARWEGWLVRAPHRPKLILMDEPSMGLSPLLVKEVFAIIRQINRDLGVTILLVEQNFRFAATIADRHYVMEEGNIVDMIPNDQLEANMDKLHEYLGV